MKRHHSLYIGEKVFDLNTNCFGIIKEIRCEDNDLNGILVLTDSDEWSVKYNTEMNHGVEDMPQFEWETENRYVYQLAEGFIATPTGNLLFWEHCREDFDDGYPFFSPMDDENFFSFEAERTTDPYMSEIAEWGDEFDEAFNFGDNEEEREQALIQYLSDKASGIVWDTAEFAEQYSQAKKYLK
jgi:hypothetical protein